jgi:hypothetical protein
MPPGYVKPYVKRNKHDAADVKAVCEAVRCQDHAASGGRLRPVLTAASATPPRSQVGTKKRLSDRTKKTKKGNLLSRYQVEPKNSCL